jgi:hypothetical protein
MIFIVMRIILAVQEAFLCGALYILLHSWSVQQYSVTLYFVHRKILRKFNFSAGVKAVRSPVKNEIHGSFS